MVKTGSENRSDDGSDGEELSNESSSMEAPPAPKSLKAEFDKPGVDQSKRFEFLLKQTEIFSHFMTNSNKDKTSPTTTGKPKGRPRKEQPKSSDSPSKDSADHRHRKTEQEEDEELLAESNAATKTITMFDSSPFYIKNGELRDYQSPWSKLDDFSL
ncbi:unnamed protein product [Bemisia tabaci]|uniref:Uncharacterized protein n=1 Tax=Bemisia tabaci TaxID=7038 RepID=A0A9P0ALL1_BEMTA|nr:unnamed protein product [Bemisia tabaci]